VCFISTNFDAPFLADLFLYSNEVDLIQGLLEKNEKKLAQFFNFTCVFLNDASPTKYIKYVVNQKLEHCDDVSSRGRFVKIPGVFLSYKIPIHDGVAIAFFYETKSRKTKRS
jgi:hypothetical protein